LVVEFCYLTFVIFHDSAFLFRSFLQLAIRRSRILAVFYRIFWSLVMSRPAFSAMFFLLALTMVGCFGGDEKKVAKEDLTEERDGTHGRAVNNQTARPIPSVELGGPLDPITAPVPLPSQNIKRNPLGTKESELDAVSKALIDANDANHLEKYIEYLSSDNPKLRSEAADAIGYIEEEGVAAIPALRVALNDPTADVRASAAWALGEIGPDADVAIPQLIRALADSSTAVQGNAAEALGKFGPLSAAAVPSLIRILKSKSYARDEVAAALSQIGDAAKSAIPFIKPLLDDGYYGNGSDAAKALGILGEVDYLISRLADKDESVRRCLVKGIANAGPATAATVAALGKLSTDADQYVRRDAVTVLGQINPKLESAVPFLLTAMKGGDEDIRRIATRGLGNFELTPEVKLTALLESYATEEDSYGRSSAITAIRKAGVEAIPVLVKIASDANNAERVRIGAAEALRGMSFDDKGMLAEAIGWLNDENAPLSVRTIAAIILIRRDEEHEKIVPTLIAGAGPEAFIDVRLDAIYDLGRTKAAEAVVAMVKALDDENHDVVRAAAGRIGVFTEQAVPAIPVLLKKAQDPQQKERDTFIRAIRDIGPKAVSALDELIVLASDEDEGVRSAICSALGNIAPTDGRTIASLKGLLKDEQSAVRESAAEAFEDAGEGALVALPELIIAASDENTHVRWEAVRTIGGIGPKAIAATPILIKSLSDESATVRQNAAQSLGKVLPPIAQTIGPLTKALADPEYDVRTNTVIALGKYNEEAAPAVPEIVKLLSDSKSYCRSNAAIALGFIGPAAKAGIDELVRVVEEDEEDFVRNNALKALPSIDASDARVVAAIIAGLKDEDSSYHVRAVLRELGPGAIPVLLAALKTDDNDVRKNALDQLLNMSNLSAARDSLAMLLDDRDADVRLRAALALAKTNNPPSPERIVEVMLTIIGDEEHDHRGDVDNAFRQMRRYSSKPLANLIVSGEASESRRIAAASMLMKQGESAFKVLPILTSGLDSEDEACKVCAAVAISHINREAAEIVEPLRVGLKSDSAALRRLTVEGVQQVPAVAETAIDDLFALMSSASEQQDANVIAYTLSRIDLPAKFHPTILELLNKSETMDAGTTLLNKIEPPMAEALPKLAEILNKVEKNQGYRIRGSMVRYGGDAAPLFLKTFANAELSLAARGEAAIGLSDLGKSGVSFAKQVVPFLQDETPSIRAYAAVILGSMGAGHAPVTDALLEAIEKEYYDDYSLEAGVEMAFRGAGKKAAAVIPKLIELLKNEENAVRALTLLPVVGKDDPTVCQAIIDFVVSNDKRHERENAAYRLSQMSEVSEPLLRSQIAAEKDEVRLERLLEALAKFDELSDETITAIMSFATHSNNSIAAFAIFSVVRRGDNTSLPVEPLLALLAEENDLRGRAINALGSLKEAAASAVPTLIELLDNEDLRYQALQTLGQIGREAVAAKPQILEFLASTDFSDTAVQALGGVGQWTDEEAEQILGLAEGDSSYVVVAAFAQENDHIDLIVTKLGEMIDENQLDGLRACRALGVKGKALLPRLQVLMKRDGIIAANAILAIGAMKEEAAPAKQDLIAAIEDDRSAYAAISALGGLGEAHLDIVDILVAELKNNRQVSNAACYYALAKFGQHAKAIVPLALADLKVKERQAAAASFLGTTKLEPATVVPALIEEIENATPTYSLTNALGRYGTAATIAIPLLQKLAESSNLDEQEMGKEALADIRRAKEE
jgi:HEAT repeat protein